MHGTLAHKMELAQGVLDGFGDLGAIKLKRGREAMFARLEQALAIGVQGSPTHVAAPPTPSDPSAAFAARARQRLDGRIVACDETWLPGSDTPVLLTVVRGPAEEQRADLEEIFRDIPWTGGRPTLQVLDTGAWDALQKLSAAGLITLNVRATRPLLPTDGQPPPAPLTPEQLARIAALRATAEKKRRAAEALVTAGMADEAAPLAQAADEADAQARAIANPQPAPATLAPTP